jgi:hypothetical protein
MRQQGSWGSLVVWPEASRLAYKSRPELGKVSWPVAVAILLRHHFLEPTAKPSILRSHFTLSPVADYILHAMTVLAPTGTVFDIQLVVIHTNIFLNDPDCWHMACTNRVKMTLSKGIVIIIWVPESF